MLQVLYNSNKDSDVKQIKFYLVNTTLYTIYNRVQKTYWALTINLLLGSFGLGHSLVNRVLVPSVARQRTLQSPNSEECARSGLNSINTCALGSELAHYYPNSRITWYSYCPFTWLHVEGNFLGFIYLYISVSASWTNYQHIPFWLLLLSKQFDRLYTARFR